jgi:hypothetical protein
VDFRFTSGTTDPPLGPGAADLGLDEAVGRCLDDLTVGRARSTADTYRYVLRRFREYLEHARPVPPRRVGELTEDDPIGFARWVSEGGRAPRTTVQLYTTAVSRLYAYLVRERHRPDLPLETIRLRLPSRCQRGTVAGWTIKRAWRQPRTRLARSTSSARSARPMRGRLVERARTISCWRSRAFSATNSGLLRSRSVAEPRTREFVVAGRSALPTP